MHRRRQPRFTLRNKQIPPYMYNAAFSLFLDFIWLEDIKVAVIDAMLPAVGAS